MRKFFVPVLCLALLATPALCKDKKQDAQGRMPDSVYEDKGSAEEFDLNSTDEAEIITYLDMLENYDVLLQLDMLENYNSLTFGEDDAEKGGDN